MPDKETVEMAHLICAILFTITGIGICAIGGVMLLNFGYIWEVWMFALFCFGAAFWFVYTAHKFLKGSYISVSTNCKEGKK